LAVNIINQQQTFVLITQSYPCCICKRLRR